MQPNASCKRCISPAYCAPNVCYPLSKRSWRKALDSISGHVGHHTCHVLLQASAHDIDSLQIVM